MPPYGMTARGARVVTEGRVLTADIGVKGGKVAAIVEGGGLEPGAVDVDATGCVVCPGGVDSHCHIDQGASTGLTPCDDFYSASVSALCGGTTTLVPFACQHMGTRVGDVVVVDNRRTGHGRMNVKGGDTRQVMSFIGAQFAVPSSVSAVLAFSDDSQNRRGEEVQSNVDAE